jgi:hypothetical protein
MHLAVGNANKRGDVAVQIQQRVHFDGTLVLPKFRPREQRQAQIDGGRIQSVQTLIEFDTDRIVEIEWPRHADQDLCKIRKDPPVAILIGVGERGARHFAAEAHVVKLAAHRT